MRFRVLGSKVYRVGFRMPLCNFEAKNCVASTLIPRVCRRHSEQCNDPRGKHENPALLDLDLRAEKGLGVFSTEIKCLANYPINGINSAVPI